jgi:polar amino acid transport system substrate-binding protein
MKVEETLMKKFLSILLALTMIFAVGALVACNDEETVNNDEEVASDANIETPEVETLVCGVTIFENMNEKDENGVWTGFETEFAQEVGKILGMNVEFQEIDWTQKYNELASNAITCIWNGFTANSSDNGIKRSDLVDFTYGYMLNQQCIVIKADNAENIKTVEDLAGKTAGVEGGSAGESYAASIIGDGSIEKYPAQNKAFIEVKTGAVDFAVMDIVLAKNICGQGDFADLMIVEDIVLDSEIYAVGFKKGSELTAKVNDAIKTLFDNGTMATLAAKYGFENTVQLCETIE